MNPTERLALILGYVFTALTLLGAADIFATSASTVGVCVFVAGIVGVVASTAAIVGVEQQRAKGGRP